VHGDRDASEVIRQVRVGHTLLSWPAATVRVAVIDSGWRYATNEQRVHDGVTVSLSATGSILIEQGNDDLIGHGTTIIRSILEIAPRANILPIRIFGERLICTPAQLLAALEWTARQDVQVVNLSLSVFDRAWWPSLYSACARLRRAGAFIISAVSSDGRESAPAAFDNVLGVGLGDYSTTAAFAFQKRGTADVLASPTSLESANMHTSYAAATVTGNVALIVGDRPGASWRHVVRRLSRRSTVVHQVDSAKTPEGT
jgi:hypothetical protein